MVKVTVSTKGKPTVTLDFPAKHPKDVTIADVKDAVHAKFPQLVPNRQRITLPNAADKDKKPLPLTDDKKTLADYGVGEDGALRLKDLGMQVGYRWLYIWEYVRGLEAH